jgi:hypothetical protein
MAEQQRNAAITDTPEFKAAVQTAVAQAVAQSVKDEVAKIIGTLKQEGAEVSPSDKRFAETLAMAFAQLNEQGNGRKYVDPQILRERGEARERMKVLVVQARKDHQAAINELVNRTGKQATQAELRKIDATYMPSYRVVAKTLLNNQVVEPMWVDASHTAQPTEIDWPGVPNEAMLPLNDVAKAIHAEFLGSIGSRPESILGAVPDATMDLEYGVTAGGLVVTAGAIPRQNRRPSEGRVLKEDDGEGLSLHHKDQPGRAVPLHVLGTIAAPAQKQV